MVVLAIVFAVAITMFTNSRQQISAGTKDDTKMAGAPHYSVVMTESHNLLVTDNAMNKIYFYTIDKDKPIGSPLKLRASVDLTKVGVEEIRITPHNLEGAK